MPDWIGDQMAGVGPEATRVFGRNAQIPVVRRWLGYMNQRQEVLLPDDPLVRVQESRRRTLASDVILRLLGVRCLKQPALI